MLMGTNLPLCKPTVVRVSVAVPESILLAFLNHDADEITSNLFWPEKDGMKEDRGDIYSFNNIQEEWCEDNLTEWRNKSGVTSVESDRGEREEMKWGESSIGVKREIRSPLSLWGVEKKNLAGVSHAEHTRTHQTHTQRERDSFPSICSLNAEMGHLLSPSLWCLLVSKALSILSAGRLSCTQVGGWERDVCVKAVYPFFFLSFSELLIWFV